MIPRKHRLPLCFFVRLFGPSKPSEVTRRSFFNLRLTYEASHPIACDGCQHARTVAGGEYPLSAVIAEPGTARFSEADMSLGWHIPQMARTGILRREFVFWRGVQLSRYTDVGLGAGLLLTVTSPKLFCLVLYYYTTHFCLSQVLAAKNLISSV